MFLASFLFVFPQAVIIVGHFTITLALILTLFNRSSSGFLLWHSLECPFCEPVISEGFLFVASMIVLVVDLMVSAAVPLDMPNRVLVMIFVLVMVVLIAIVSPPSLQIRLELSLSITLI